MEKGLRGGWWIGVVLSWEGGVPRGMVGGGNGLREGRGLGRERALFEIMWGVGRES